MATHTAMDRISYIGRSTYIVTAVTRDRCKAFADLEFGRMCEGLLAEHAKRQEFDISAYCMMPDHVHLVATGRALSSDLRRLVTNWKQATGFVWSRKGRTGSTGSTKVLPFWRSLLVMPAFRPAHGTAILTSTP